MKRNFTRAKKNEKFLFFKNKNVIKESKNVILKKHLNLKPNQLIISGNHAVLSALQNTQRKSFYLISTKDHYVKWEKSIKDLGLTTQIQIKTKEQLDIIKDYKTHQNIIVLVEHLKRITRDYFLQEKQLKST